MDDYKLSFLRFTVWFLFLYYSFWFWKTIVLLLKGLLCL